tara:strand:- start:6418 stop:7071 length:654 start_codon:yes stop_codon:yes gene_type:complete
MYSALEKHVSKGISVYDIGCGSKPFASFLENKVAHYIGVDLEDGFYSTEHIDLVGSAYDIPVDSAKADALISCQVMEHLECPEDAIAEAARALKKGGLLFLSYPFLYPMHALPRDFVRYTEYYMNQKLEQQGFEILEQAEISGFWYVMGLYISIYLQTFDRGILAKIRLIKLINICIKWVFYQIHSLEGAILKISKKDLKEARQSWTINYVAVAKKK